MSEVGRDSPSSNPSPKNSPPDPPTLRWFARNSQPAQLWSDPGEYWVKGREGPREY